MQTRPLVSVILPNYNYARYLKNRIEGILNQSFQDIELILLDDKSTDDSVEVMRQYEQHPKVSALIVNEKNSGSPFFQWEKGISMAKGKYIWIAEADDEALPDFLSTCVEALEANPRASICYTSSTHIDPEGNAGIPRHKPTRTEGYSVYNGIDFARHNLYWRNYIENASGILFRHDAYKQLDSKSWTEMRYSGDWLFWFLMAMEGDIVRVHKPLNKFRIHSNSVTGSSMSGGKRYIEDALIIHAMELHIQPTIDTYRHWIRTGQLYRRINKYVTDSKQKRETIEEVNKLLHTPFYIRYIEILNRLLRWLPFTISMKRDALPDTYSW